MRNASSHVVSSAGAQLRQRAQQHRLPGPRPEHAGLALVVVADGAVCRPEQERGIRHGQQQMGQRHTRHGAGETEPDEGDLQPQRHRERRHQQRRQQQELHEPPAAELVQPQGPPGRQADEAGQRRHQRRDHQRGAERRGDGVIGDQPDAAAGQTRGQHLTRRPGARDRPERDGEQGQQDHRGERGEAQMAGSHTALRESVETSATYAATTSTLSATRIVAMAIASGRAVRSGSRNRW